MEPLNLTPLPASFFADDATIVAQKLLGKIIEFNSCRGIIVETEAYTDDPASHGYKITPKSKIMQDSHAFVYVYVIYGMYHCLNFTTNKDSIGAVLIRAIQPLTGTKIMHERRKSKKRKTDLKIKDLCSGPGKLCQAFDISKLQNNVQVNEQIKVYDNPNFNSQNSPAILQKIVHTTRIGITKGTDLPWRYYIRGNQFISKK